ncbi:MAG TPA: 3-oxoadipate enol-lactonase [Burkholderiales bacterium]|nr:3-oxoadipate enol-lactonase [Burkholderiales bacterium]
MKATVNGIETNYEIHGKEGAPWLAFSHSLACDLRMWDGQVEAFKDRFRILTYDTRGHGASAAPKGAYTLEQMADDLHGLLAHLKIDKLHFCGLSMGGMIGQTFALKYPGKFASLTLADTSSGYPAGTVAIWEERIRTVEAKGMGALVQSTVERWFTPPFREKAKDKVAKIAAQIERTPPAGYIGCCHAIPRLNLTARLKEIQCPTLVICGEDDAGTPPAMARTIHENLAGSKLVLIPQAAHLSNLEQPEAFNRALREFL